MDNQMDLTFKIEQAYRKMSKSHKRIADFITDNYDKAAFMTASKLGETVNISESTVVRFADALGYDGYPHLQKELQEIIKNKLTTVQRIEMTGALDSAEILNKVLKGDMENIRHTMQDINPNNFDSVVESILSANRVYIMGMRSAAPLAQFLGYYLDFVLSNVRIVNAGISDTFEQLIHIGKGDLFIGISFPRYSSRTIEGMRFASDRGAKCIAVTDSVASPIAQQAHVTLTAHSNMASFVDSLVAPFSIVNALIVAVSLRKKMEISDNFSQLEKIWREYSVYTYVDEVK